MVRITITTRIAATLVGGLAALGAAPAIGSAPTANATCFSAFGVNNSADCTSNLTSVAIAIGTGAQAKADGLLGVAFAFGDTASAFTAPGGAANLAVTIGGGTSGAYGYVSAALNLGGAATRNAIAGTSAPAVANLAIDVGGQTGTTESGGIGNVAVNLFSGGNTVALGVLNNTFNVGSNGVAASGVAYAQGIFSNAIRVAANQGRTVAVGSFANWAFDAFGSNNAVGAGPGPLALAGSIAQTGQTITKSGPGININGLVIGGAASSPAPAATSHRTRKASPAATARAATPRPTAAAASRARSR